ncbi:hypothetical protein AX14_007289, partial [Amanita brunnescens Koide BX004]
DENVAHIFDVEWLNNQHPAPVSLGGVPLSPEDPDFAQQHYWCLPLPTEAILGALEEVMIWSPEMMEELDQARVVDLVVDLVMIVDPVVVVGDLGHTMVVTVG